MSNTWNLLRDLSLAYHGAGNMEKVISTSQQLLTILKKQKKEPTDRLIGAIEQLAKAYVHLNKPLLAEKLLQENLDSIPKDQPQREKLKKLLDDIHQSGGK